jgi:hypothetical protein
MKPQLYLTIPTPCHENWDAMTPNQQGKFCQSCSKTVVDFTTMTDAEVLNFFKQNTTNTCGRFNHDQLDRKIVEQTAKQNKSLKWLFASMFSLAIFTKTAAQNKLLGKVKYNNSSVIREPKKDSIVKGDTILNHDRRISKQIINTEIKIIDTPTLKPNKVDDQLICITVGGVVARSYDADEPFVYIPPPPVNIKGIIVDENHQPIPYATVQIKNKKGTISDSKGKFDIEINRLKNNLIVEISCLGFETKIINLNKYSNANLGVIQLKAKSQELKEVVVNGNYSVLMGDISSGIPIRHKKNVVQDTLQNIKISVKKLLGFEMFSVYPNPAKIGNPITIKPKEAGEYIIQLFDNQSKLLYTQSSVLNKNQAFQIPLPTIVNGVFYIRLVNEKSKKTWIEKIVATL